MTKTSLGTNIVAIVAIVAIRSVMGVACKDKDKSSESANGGPSVASSTKTRGDATRMKGGVKHTRRGGSHDEHVLGSIVAER